MLRGNIKRLKFQGRDAIFPALDIFFTFHRHPALKKIQKEAEILKRRKPPLYLGPPTVRLLWLRSSSSV